MNATVMPFWVAKSYYEVSYLSIEERQKRKGRWGSRSGKGESYCHGANWSYGMSTVSEGYTRNGGTSLTGPVRHSEPRGPYELVTHPNYLPPSWKRKQ